MRVSRWLAAWLLGGTLLGGAAVLAQTDPTPMPIPTPTIETPTALPTLPFTWVSPTPDETGVITVIVQPGESLWVIAARAGLSLPELLALNNLTDADVINPGDVLIIGQARRPRHAAAGAPPSGSPTPTLPPPTLRLERNTGRGGHLSPGLDDLNRDGIHDAGEPLRAGVAFTVYNTAVVANYVSDGVSSQSACVVWCRASIASRAPLPRRSADNQRRLGAEPDSRQ
jgi:LysM repeat protein